MISVLRAGMLLLLPSGNQVVLVRREGAEWTCAYAPGSTRRGEVSFSGAFLRRTGAVC